VGWGNNALAHLFNATSCYVIKSSLVLPPQLHATLNTLLDATSKITYLIAFAHQLHDTLHTFVVTLYMLFFLIHKNFSCTFTQLNATFIWAAVSRNWQPQRNVWNAGKEHKKGPKCCKGCRMPLPSETLTGILDVLVLLMSSFKEIIKTHNLMTIQGLKVQKPSKTPGLLRALPTKICHMASHYKYFFDGGMTILKYELI
jgi:hypothetical protein